MSAHPHQSDTVQSDLHPSDSYVLGCDREELERLGRQHAIWRDDCRRVWRQAGFGSGQRLLDLGCGPGFASLDLADLVGRHGLVLGIDSAAPYLQHLRERARHLDLPQLQALQRDLGAPAPAGSMGLDHPAPGAWDGAWCRWLAMFLPQLDPLLDLVQQALRPGGALVLHEYVRWDTFSLHPQGAMLQRFVACCIRHWRDHGGDPDVASRLPALLERRGFRLAHGRSLMACSAGTAPKALWLQDFLASYPSQLMAAGVWSPSEQEALRSELEQAQRHASLWVTPALVEMVWIRC
ncbi:Methyltransferase domain family [Cyanobium sp. PCC 7001]|uniref:methyltransferase domain-containing protein n=1 Tax=Cyanobium sp. PCC 7001 TaxID=180281 RepID=UPI00018050AC|nr:methyltransferase domain-containing protein [Cyanobium sp. PCC 7001]EDY39187.1 Methyltransferase domain family [Cyanobium sp. PCC 7001]